MVTRFTNGFLSCVQYRLRTKSSFLKFKRRHWKTIKLLIRAETQSDSNESGWWRRKIQAVCDLKLILWENYVQSAHYIRVSKTLRVRYQFLQMVHIKQRFQGLAWYVTSIDTSVFFFFSRLSMYIQTITGSTLAIILKTFLPQGRVSVWTWVQITNIVVWKHLITFKSGRLYSFEPKTEY